MKDFDVTGAGFSRWVGILSKDATAPKKGLYLIANVYRGQGFDVEYEVQELEQGERFDKAVLAVSRFLPIAYHLIPDDQWIKTNLMLHKGEGACIPAPISGIAVISLLDARLHHRSTVTYYLDKVNKFQDITVLFKWQDSAGPTCFSDEYDGYMVQGFHMAFLYDVDVCYEHIRLRRYNEPDFLG